MRKILGHAGLATLLMAAIASAAPIYDTAVDAANFTGSRSIGNGLAGTGAWGTDPQPNIMITWTITNNGDGTLHYRYEFSGDTGAIAGEPSHMILGLSSNCSSTSNCVTNAEADGSSATLVFGSFDGTSPSNPGMPASIFGVKFDSQGWVYEFDSNRAPVWGDIYAKDGNAGGAGTNAVWNTGLTLHLTSENPLDFIARPDTQFFDDPGVPEPGTMALFGLGAVLLGIYRRSR